MANIIFDFDGTIADSFDYVFNFLCKEARKPPEFAHLHADEYRMRAMRDIATQLGIPFWRLPYVYFKGRRVMRQHVLHVQPFPGMLELIKDFKADGHTLSIISSNSAKNVRSFLRQHDMLGNFKVIKGGAGILGKARPIRQIKRIQPDVECWYIGDEVGDVLNAKLAGVRSIAVSWGFASRIELEHSGPEVIVDKVTEIPPIIQAA